MAGKNGEKLIVALDTWKQIKVRPIFWRKSHAFRRQISGPQKCGQAIINFVKERFMDDFLMKINHVLAFQTEAAGKFTKIESAGGRVK